MLWSYINLDHFLNFEYGPVFERQVRVLCISRKRGARPGAARITEMVNLAVLLSCAFMDYYHACFASDWVHFIPRVWFDDMLTIYLWTRDGTRGNRH